MSLVAELAARQAEIDHAGLLEGLKERQKRQKMQIKKMRAMGGLIGHFRTCCHAWIQRFQQVDHREAQHAVKEMRKVLKKIERTMNEAET